MSSWAASTRWTWCDPTIIVLSESDVFVTYAHLIVDQATIDPLTPSAADHTSYQQYTSGTTGLPKSVELTNNNFFAMMPVAGQMWGFDSDSVNLLAMPLFHIAVSGWGVVGLFNDGTNILIREVDPAAILNLIPKHGVINVLFVPTVIQFLQIMPNLATTGLSTLRAVMHGASPITEDVLVGCMNALGCDLRQVYGLTETTGVVTQLDLEDHDSGGPRANLLRSADKPVPGTTLRIVDEQANTLPDGEAGEIWVHSPQNLKACSTDPEATAKAFPLGPDENGMGWSATGDAGYLKDGYLFIHDRIKDMIASGAKNIYPAEIDNVLMSHPGVADAPLALPPNADGRVFAAVLAGAVTATAGELSSQRISNDARSFRGATDAARPSKGVPFLEWVEHDPNGAAARLLTDNQQHLANKVEPCEGPRQTCPSTYIRRVIAKFHRLLLIITFALVILGCGADGPGPPLTQSAYATQGNTICEQMNAELDALSIRASQSISPEEGRDLFVQANLISRDALDALFDLSPPTSLVNGRQSLLELVEERRDLIERMHNGEDFFDEITDVNLKFEDEARSIWPNCTT